MEWVSVVNARFYKDFALMERRLNAKPHVKKVNWQFTMDDARIKLRRLYPVSNVFEIRCSF